MSSHLGADLRPADVVVVGAGVMGLSAAVLLAERGRHVRVVARELPQETTSGVAAAIWYPYRVHPPERAIGWGRHAYEVFTHLAHETGTGVSLREAVELFRVEPPWPWWADVVSLRRCTPSELPSGAEAGLAFRTLVVEMPMYLDYLQERLRLAGGGIERRSIGALDELAGEAGAVVNCTGLGARDVAHDSSVTPIRGQVVRVANPGLDRVLLDEHHPAGVTYVVPRSFDCVLGGTADTDDSSIEPDPKAADEIINRCVGLEPRLSGAPVLGHRVGLRPGRPNVRLEVEQLPSGSLCVHNYGHGGAGVTLSWGCAEEVAGLLDTHGTPRRL